MSHSFRLRALHQLLRFPTLAPFMGLGTAADFVVSGGCPYCRTRAWYTTYDTGAAAAWHYCMACGKSGHILDLLCDRQELQPEELFPYLRTEVGLPISAEMEQAYDAYRETLRIYATVLRAAQQSLLSPSRTQRQLLRQLGVLAAAPTSAERWFEGFGQFCGVTDLATLRAHKLPVPSRGNAPCLVVPFCIVPGYAHRLHLITSDKSWDLGATLLAEPSLQETAPAYAGMQLLHRLDTRWFIGTTMLDVMLRAQARRLSIDADPLPLFGWSANEASVSLPSLSLLQNRPVVLWERTLTPQVLQLAVFLGARIALGFPSPEVEQTRSRSDILSFVDRTSPYALCREIRKIAKTPYTVLCRWWSQADEPNRLRLYDACLHFSDVTAELVQRLTNRPRVPTRRWYPVRVGTEQYVIQQNRLYDSSGCIVAPYVLRIRRLVWMRDNLFCVLGVVLAPGRSCSIRFYARFVRTWKPLHTDKVIAALVRSGFESGSFAQMPARQLLRTLFYASLRTHKPKTEKGLHRTGWSKNWFLLPNHRISHRIKARRYLLLRSTPGPQRIPDKMRFQDCDGCSAAVRTFYWSVLFALCVQATACRAQCGLGGIVLRTVPADTLQKIVQAFGCKLVPKTGFWPHDWPYFYAGVGTEATSGNVSFYVTDHDTEFSASTSLGVVVCDALSELSDRLCTELVASLIRYIVGLSTDRPHCASWEECVETTRERFEALCPGSTEHITAFRLVSR